MNVQTGSRSMVQAPGPTGPHQGYMPGFGNDFETEALADALPQGMNSPQKCNYGLYGEQLSGTAFTANPPERTWSYRIRPSVKHSARYQKIAGVAPRVVAPVLNGICYSCFVALATARASEADRNSRVASCEYCGCFLYHPD